MKNVLKKEYNKGKHVQQIIFHNFCSLLTLTVPGGGGGGYNVRPPPPSPCRFFDCCILRGRDLKLILCDFSSNY